MWNTSLWVLQERITFNFKIQMMKKLIIMAAIFLGMANEAFAVPAKRVVRTLKLEGGKTIDVTLHGDEHFSYYTSKNGDKYVLSNGILVPVSNEIITATWTELANRRATHRKPAKAKNHNAPNYIGTKPSAITGKHRGLVILMQYTDAAFVTPDVKTVYQRFFNEQGYKDGGMTGSVRDYFLEQSYGNLEIDFDVVGPYTTNYGMAYYGANEDGKKDNRAPYMIAEAVDAASKEVDFTNYDWDNDGEVDQVFVIYAGYNEAQGANENTIWPHEYSLAATGMTRTYNGKTINTYGCTSELRGSGRMGDAVLDGIGTACHEFSHCLGLPDMYDTSGGDNYTMDSWDIMSSGSYNDNSRTPAGYTAYERWFSGWLEPKEINTKTQIKDMEPITQSPEAYILYNDGNKNEYYLLENRQPTGFDRGLPGHGLLVVHVDYDENRWETNSINQDGNHQRMNVIPADNSMRISSADVAGDTWPGTSGNTALTNVSTPAATLFNMNTDGSYFMNKAIENITENADNQTVSFVLCRPELAVPQPLEGKETGVNGEFTISWTAVDDAASYEVELASTDKAPDNPAEALKREYTFDECVSKTTGFTDIGSRLPSYGLSGWQGEKLFTTPNKLRIGTSTVNGYLQTPTWSVPQSSDITIVLGSDIVKAGNTVKVNISFMYGNNGEQATTETSSFEVTGACRTVLHFKNIRKDLFYMQIAPQGQMYINYFAVYDGIWTEQQLGLTEMPQKTMARVSSSGTFTTETNSYTFKGLDTSKRYSYRVRAIGVEGNVSAWSDEQNFEFTSTGIKTFITNDAMPTEYYNFGGYRINTHHKGLIIKKKGRNVKKVIVR